MNDTDIRGIEAAIEQSRVAASNGEYPYGAVLAHGGQIVLAGYNTTQSTKDITAHAELSLIRAAGTRFSTDYLSQCTLYASCEPCAMCAGALYWSGISRLVYACSTQLDATISQMPFAIPCRSLLHVPNGHTVDVQGPLLEEVAAKVLEAFWNKHLSDSAQSFGLSV